MPEAEDIRSIQLTLVVYAGYCVVHVDPEGSQPAETLHDPQTGELTNWKPL